MNIDGIYAANLTYSKSSIKTEGEGNKVAAYEAGQIIEGIVSKVSEKVSINFSGRELSFPKEAVPSAKEGETRIYKIMDVSGANLVLKEIGSTTLVTGSNSSILFTTVETDQKVLLESASSQEASDTEEEESLDGIASRMTGSDYADLSDEGMSIEKFNLERLTKALERIKSQKSLRESSIEGQKEELEADVEEAKKIATSSAISAVAGDAMSELIAERLIAANLPATKDNISRITNAMNLAKEATQMTEASFSYLIDNQLKPTIENIYKAVHVGTANQISLPDTVWSKLKDSAEEIITTAGFKVNSSTLYDARWLVEQELPLTAENLQYKQTLNEIKTNITTEDVLSAAVDAISTNTAPVQAVLSTDVQLVMETDIQEKTQAGTQTITTQTIAGNIELIIAQRQREEIRLQMTLEAVDTMRDIGIETDTEELQRIVEDLKQKEAVYYKNLCQETGLSESDNASIDLLKRTTETMVQLKNVPEYILGSTITTSDTETISSLASKGAMITSALTRAGERYEVLMTTPRKDMGDSIQKAFLNVDSTLQNMNLEVTEANRKAVRILGYNSIPITNENLSEMKLYDAKVTELMINLKPAVTVELIKQGINPLEVPIDTLNKTVSQVLTEQGSTPEEKYSEYLVKLDSQKALTEEERKSYIGIYRLLNNVAKTDGAAIGALVQTGRDITLGNLLTSVRTLKKGSIDVNVDDDFGAIESLTYSKETITDQVNSAFTNTQGNVETEYQEHVLTDILKNISPDKLTSVLRDKKDNINNLTLESMKEQLQSAESGETDRAWVDNQTEMIQKLATNSAQEMKFLQDFGVSNTINNIIAAKELLKGESWYKKLETIAEGIEIAAEGTEIETLELNDFTESMVNKETLSAAYIELEKNAESMLNAVYAKDPLDIETIEALKLIQAGRALGSSLRSREYYEIPVEDSSGITNLNLTILHGEAESGKFNISINKEGLGKIKVEASIDKKSLDMLVTCETKNACDALKAAGTSLSESLKGTGLDAVIINYTVETKTDIGYIYRNGGIYKEVQEQSSVRDSARADTKASASTDELYAAAKQTVLYIRQVNIE